MHGLDPFVPNMTPTTPTGQQHLSPRRTPCPTCSYLVIERWSPPAGKASCLKTDIKDKSDEPASQGAYFCPEDEQGGCGCSLQQPGAKTSKAGTGKSPPNCPIHQMTPEGPLTMKGLKIFFCGGLQYYYCSDVSWSIISSWVNSTVAFCWQPPNLS